ncbi:unnamed protein product, partial [Rotaria socialis]
VVVNSMSGRDGLDFRSG